LEKIKFIHESLIDVDPSSLDETITNFKRDQNPESEIDIWLTMVNAYLPFAEKNPAPEALEARKEAFKLIMLRSMLPDEEAIVRAELTILTKAEAQEILSDYTLEAKPIVVCSKQ
jgi:hypothetical protein